MAWRRFVENYTPDAVEINLEAAGSTPLFGVQLEVVTEDGVNPHVSIVPGRLDIEIALKRILDDVVAAVKVSYPLFFGGDRKACRKCSH